MFDPEPREYQRPSAKHVLDFAHGEPTMDNIEDFALEHGRLHSLLVAERRRTFSTAQLQPGGLPEEMPGSPWSEATPKWRGEPETFEQWRSEWEALHQFEELYAYIGAHPSERPDTPPAFSVAAKEGPFSGDAILSPMESEPFVVVSRDEALAEPIAQASRVVLAALNLYPVASGFAVVDGRVVQWRAPTLHQHMWSEMYLLLTGRKHARRCAECGVWEEKGDGYERASWIQHKRCGWNRRQREKREREREEDENWEHESTKKTPPGQPEKRQCQPREN